MIHGAQLRSSAVSTEPRFMWARVDVVAVTTIVDSDVPTAKCMLTALSTPISVNSVYKTGTMTMPPPTPSKPASIPVKTPAPTIAPPNVAYIVHVWSITTHPLAHDSKNILGFPYGLPTVLIMFVSPSINACACLGQIGRASCRERVRSAGVAESIQKKEDTRWRD